MHPSRPAFDSPKSSREVLVAARWLDADRRAWVRQCHPIVTAAGRPWTLVAPEDADLARLQEDLPNCPVVAVPSSGAEYPLWRALRPLVASGRYGAIHAIDLPSAGHASLACLGSKVPLLVSVPNLPSELRYAGLVGSFERWLLGRALAGATAITVAGEEVKHALLRLFPNLRACEKKIPAISDGVDVHGYRLDNIVAGLLLRRELELDDETMLLGFLGPLTHDAGFPLLLDAVARLTRFGGVPAFHIVAFGEQEKGNSAVEKLGLCDLVSVRPPAMDLPAVLEQLDLVVTPAVRSTSPCSVMEAMCAGVPVLASDSPGLRGTLSNTPGRTVQAGVLTALEKGLRQALREPWFTESAAFAPVACQRFDYRRGVGQLLRVYDEATTNAPAMSQAALAAGG